MVPLPPLTSFSQPRFDEECFELEYLMQIASGGGRVVGYCGMRSEVGDHQVEQGDHRVELGVSGGS